jgi:hypothetical protein
MPDNTTSTPLSSARDARQRRTVLGFLEDLRDKIKDKQACCAVLQTNLDKSLTELHTLEALLAAWEGKAGRADFLAQHEAPLDEGDN